MPVKKVHVKGKRKAPLPPTSQNQLPNGFNSIHIENKRIENCFPAENPNAKISFCNKRKKAAPLPPLSNAAILKHDKNNELNNFSVFSTKFDEKIGNGTMNLNIFEAPVHIRNDLQFTTKQNNDMKRDPDQFGETMNLTRENKENDQVWICNYCTLRNPFWKIVCDACERIKPYNTPNISMSNAFDVNYTKDIPQQMDNINIRNSVKMRTKTLNVDNDVEHVFKRSSMKVDAQSNFGPAIPAGCGVKLKEQKMINRPISVCFPSNTHENPLNTPQSLELEKDRIRAMIRSMNNRALAQKYSANLEKPLNVPQYSGAIKKNMDRSSRNASKMYDKKRDYNLPKVKEDRNYENYLSQTDDSKANFNLEISIGKPDKNAPTYYFDSTVLGAAAKTFDLKLGSKNVATDNRVPRLKKISDAGGGNKLSINLYVNFNKAVEAKIHHRMTLGEFKNFISKNVAPSKCPKIYFNGMLLRTEGQMLINYGVKDGSSLYINTENVVAHTRNDSTSLDKPTYEMQNANGEIVNGEKELNAMEEIEIKQKVNHVMKSEDKTAIQPRNDIEINSTKNAGEKYLIEHIQFDRFTIEKINPELQNLSKIKYRGVYNYNPRCNPDLTQILAKKAEIVKNPMNTILTGENKNPSPDTESISSSGICDTVNQYMELLSLDDSMDLTKNTEIFECSICLVDYQPLEGVMLRNCLHTFCKDCTRNSIIYSDEAEVKCPYIDKEYSCEYFLQDREIKALLTKLEYDEHLAKSLRIAENQIQNSFHCRTPNCKGWCIYEDDVNVFKCPICNLGNCLTCRVIHDGLDCKQYQTMMQNNADSNPDNATSVTLLEDMVKNGEAMHCPTCRIVLMKKWGCDWLKCSMCKTEICWITRGPRWGPAGKGDTSAGCRCGVDGFRCHPKCTYCH